jgi:alkaline phosphatase
MIFSIINGKFIDFPHIFTFLSNHKNGGDWNMTNIFRNLTAFSVLLLLLVNGSLPTLAQGSKQAKNVIFMIMDGTNSDVLALSRWYKGSALALDGMMTGGVRTYSLQSAITDSAAAGTALATGRKTLVDHIGMIPIFPEEGKPYTAYPVPNILEAAERKGLSTGIVSTSPVQHATPAAFSSHVNHRNKFNDIAEQQVYQGMDVVLGGGGAWLKRDNKIKSRPDGENLISVLQKKGYDYVTTRKELLQSSGEKIWGSFAKEDIAYELDRQKLNPNQPSLAEMTRKAIQTLSKNNKGFFLMVEGSKVDWAAHKNDPVGMISEVLSFDEAVQEALHFAKKDQQTLVIAVADHGNSGLTMGNHSTNHSYASEPKEHFVEPLKKANLTVTGAVSQLRKDRSNLKEVLKSYGLDSLSLEEYNLVKKSKNPEKEMAALLSKRAKIGFTTTGHTGEDVFLFAYGPGKPTGLVENTDLPKSVCQTLGLKLQSYYQDGVQYYKNQGFKTTIYRKKGKNPELVVQKGGQTIRYPVNKNIRFVDGKEETLPAVNLFNGTYFYIGLPNR